MLAKCHSDPFSPHSEAKQLSQRTVLGKDNELMEMARDILPQKVNGSVRNDSCYLRYEVWLLWKSQGNHFPCREWPISLSSVLKQPVLLVLVTGLQKESTSDCGFDKDRTSRAKAEPDSLHCSSASYIHMRT